jgi:DNA polymerase III alpha subunit
VTPPGFAEVGARTNFTLLDGASHPAEMVAVAAELGHAGIGVCDTNGLAGVVRAHVAAKDIGIPFIVGTRLVLDDDARYLVWPTDRASYGRLTRLLSLGRMRAPKGQCQIDRSEMLDHAEGWAMAAIPPPVPDTPFAERLRRTRAISETAWRGHCCVPPRSSTTAPIGIGLRHCRPWQQQPVLGCSQPPTRAITIRIVVASLTC